MEAALIVLTILQGDALDKLCELPTESVHCCVTSPPYWGLRDYGTAQWEMPTKSDNGQDKALCDHIEPQGGSDPVNSAKQLTSVGARQIQYRDICGKCGAKQIDSQLGLEKTPEEYVTKMVEVFREVRRVLRKDGTLWLNLGDSYAGGKSHTTDGGPTGIQRPGYAALNLQKPDREVPPGLKPKDLCGIPWRVAFALQADGWWLRSDIIWAKPNPMPESVTDRPTKSHEYLFLLTKSASYFYDAEAIKEKGIADYEPHKFNGGKAIEIKNPLARNISEGLRTIPDGQVGNPGSRNKRSVWTVATAPYPEAHFATYPPDLIKPCILAGTSAKGCCAKCGAPWERVVEKGEQPNVNRLSNAPGYLRPKDGDILVNRGWNGRPVRDIASNETIGWQTTCTCSKFHSVPDVPNIACTVLDPFAGSGTTGAVALELGRKAILIELNSKYVELIERRCDVTPGLALA